MRNNIKTIIVGIVCFAFGLSFVVVSYANSYNSEEISYDTSTSGAVQANVKDALDFLYNKTKSGASAECPENMSCVEKPGVVMNVTGPGSVNKGTVYVGLDESNTFTVTPDNGNVLTSISCDNGYTLSSYKTNQNSSSKSECEISQEITITNPGVITGATCNIYFGSYDINVSSTNLHSTYKSDTCNSNSSGCICYQIKNNVTNFTYESHTGCNFKSTSCYHTYNDSGTFNCVNLFWDGFYSWYDNSGYFGNGLNSSACSGVITCAT